MALQIDTIHPPVPLAPGYYCRTTGLFPGVHQVTALVPVKHREGVEWTAATLTYGGRLEPITERVTAAVHLTPDQAGEFQKEVQGEYDRHEKVARKAYDLLDEAGGAGIDKVEFRDWMDTNGCCASLWLALLEEVDGVRDGRRVYAQKHAPDTDTQAADR